MSADSPIFIVGAARSGTTLLQYMLRSHPDISMPTAESHFFIPFYHRRDEFGDISQFSDLRFLLESIYKSRKNFFDEEVHGIRFDPECLARQLLERKCRTIPEVISGIFQVNAEAEGKVRWGDKTPYYILHLNTILEMFPNAQIIHLIRDGRDCALSMQERKWDLQIYNIYHAGITWNKYVTAGREFGKQHPECYFEILYEDVLNDPETAVKRLCEYLQVDFSSSVINYKKSTYSGRSGEPHNLQKDIQKNNQSKWKKKMSPKQLSIFEAIAGNTLRDCGYELQNDSTFISRLDWFVNESHIKFCSFLSKQMNS
ncbi:sulfotransferase [Gammaproteobacteria bacterium]|nr:sulfotransferase [Gammaproteobacteria bacterium]